MWTIRRATQRNGTRGRFVPPSADEIFSTYRDNVTPSCSARNFSAQLNEFSPKFFTRLKKLSFKREIHLESHIRACFRKVYFFFFIRHVFREKRNVLNGRVKKECKAFRAALSFVIKSCSWREPRLEYWIKLDTSFREAAGNDIIR